MTTSLERSPSNSTSEAYVVVATKGRPTLLRGLLDCLTEQTNLPRRVVVVGSEEADIQGAEGHALARSGALQLCVSKPGSCAQRNAALDWLSDHVQALGISRARDMVVFFDDDFRAHPRWLEACRSVFDEAPDVVGLTGQVLADGASGSPISEEDARAYIQGHLAPLPHWAVGTRPRALDCLYGCNMAFRALVLDTCRFDENLPLYGWQEDLDFCAQARRLGRLEYAPGCLGVHLGTRAGRTSGRRFGYSQIANPWYLARKGTMPAGKGLRFVSRHLASNALRSLIRHPDVDYPGRLSGNFAAIHDLVRGRSHPTRILEM